MMFQRRFEFVFGLSLPILIVCSLAFLPGCVNMVSKSFRAYDGPALAPDKIAVLICMFNAQINIDDKENVNPESQKWGGRIEMLPGTHRVGICPYAKWMGPGYTNLPEVLPEDVLYFEAVAGKAYKVIFEKQAVDKTLKTKTEKAEIYIVNDIIINFYIIESDSKKIVSRRTA